jgi:hypothetical protein
MKENYNEIEIKYKSRIKKINTKILRGSVYDLRERKDNQMKI